MRTRNWLATWAEDLLCTVRDALDDQPILCGCDAQKPCVDCLLLSDGGTPVAPTLGVIEAASSQPAA